MKKNSEQITHSSFPVCLNLRGEISFKEGRFVTPTFCIIKFDQARCALGCILEFSLKKIFLNLIVLRLHSWHGMFYFLKILEKPRRI
jgi:hypothetical protein